MCDVSRGHAEKATPMGGFFCACGSEAWPGGMLCHRHGERGSGRWNCDLKVNEAIDPRLAVFAVLVDDRGGYRVHGERKSKSAFVDGSFWLLWCASGNGTVP